MPEQIPVHLDCDTGIDDALAIAQLLSRTDVDLVGISTVSGNIDAAQAAVNTRNLLALAGRGDVPVAAGPDDPLVGEYRGGAAHVHGENGIGGVRLPAADEAMIQPARDEDGRPLSGPELIVRSAREHAGALELVAVCPLTNLARALALDPELAHRVRRVTVMGGAVWVPGNITEHAEANIMNDPEAAQIVLDAPWPVTLVPLDVTLAHTIGVDEQRALAERGTAFHAALADMLHAYLDFYQGVFGERRSALHDPLAAMLATGDASPSTVRRTALAVEPSTSGARGRTVPVPEGRPIDVVTAVQDTVDVVLMRRMLAVPTPDAPGGQPADPAAPAR